MEKKDILHWSEKYDIEYPWWTQRERELGDRFRIKKELTKDDLIQLVEWKFKDLPGRRNRVLELVAENDDVQVRNISRNVLTSPLYKIDMLCTLSGVGPALASTILTFYDPKNYGVFDIHVWREMFGEEPKNLFTPKNYLKLLFKLRKIAELHGLNVRTVEKAFFKKNIDEATS